MNLTLLIVAGVVGVVTTLDWLIYMFKSPPKQATFSYFIWLVGFISIVYFLYQFIK